LKGGDPMSIHLSQQIIGKVISQFSNGAFAG
jgi:hypothetical protein